MPMSTLMSSAADVESSSVLTPGGLLTYLRSPAGKKWFLYGSVSGIAIAVSWITLFTCLHLGMSEIAAGTAAVITSTIPAYFLSRRWVWIRQGDGSIRREITVFWLLSFVQFLVSLAILAIAGRFIKPRVDSKSLQALLFNIVNLGTYGAMWIGKFLFLNRVLFAEKANVAEPSLT